MPYSALQIAADLNVTGDRQTFVVSNPNESGTLSVKTTIEPTNALSVDTSISIRDSQENGVVLSYTSEENDTDNIAKLSLSKNGAEETVFTIDQNEIVKMLYALQAKAPVHDDDVATKKFVLDNAGSGGGGGGGVAQTYVDAQDTVTLNSAKTFTTSQLASYVSSSELTTALSTYAKTVDMQTADTTTLDSAKAYTDTAVSAITQGSSKASTIASDVTWEKNSSTNASNLNISAVQVNTTLSNQQTFFKTIFPNNNYVSAQMVGDNANGVQLYCGTQNTLWVQILNTGATNNILVKMPIRFEPQGTFSFEDTHLVTKAYVEAQINSKTQQPVLIGCPTLVPSAQFGGYSGLNLWTMIKDFMGYGEWRVPGDTISSASYPLAVQRIGETIPSLSSGNSALMYVFRVL